MEATQIIYPTQKGHNSGFGIKKRRIPGRLANAKKVVVTSEIKKGGNWERVWEGKKEGVAKKSSRMELSSLKIRGDLGVVEQPLIILDQEGRGRKTNVKEKVLRNLGNHGKIEKTGRLRGDGNWGILCLGVGYQNAGERGGRA